MWFAIDMADDSSSVWFYWPMLGTGIAVAITGIVLLGIGGLMGADWERRETSISAAKATSQDRDKEHAPLRGGRVAERKESKQLADPQKLHDSLGPVATGAGG